MRVLGVDPGSVVCGYGVLEEVGGRLVHVDNGCIAPGRKGSFNDRLKDIYDGLSEMIERFGPDEVALEDSFFSRNVKSAIKLGQARGVCILAALNAGLPVAEYPPMEVKQSVTGYGRADKSQVSKMVMTLLSLPEVAAEDASDALAVAICHLNSRRLAVKISGKSK